MPLTKKEQEAALAATNFKAGKTWGHYKNL